MHMTRFSCEWTACVLEVIGTFLKRLPNSKRFSEKAQSQQLMHQSIQYRNIPEFGAKCLLSLDGKVSRELTRRLLQHFSATQQRKVTLPNRVKMYSILYFFT